MRGQGQTRALQLAAKKAHSKALAGLLPRGVAIHNAELSMADRALVEELFLERHVLVLCSTCTLAMGVNLPAHMVSRAAAGGRQARGCARAPAGRPGANATAGPVPPPQVVIKGTRMYAGDKGTYEDYDTSMINQMAGRAGRPDFDTQGVCVIMTAKSDSRRIEARARGSEVLESHLRGNLCEVLNSEVRRAGGEGRWARGAARAARQAGRRTPPLRPPSSRRWSWGRSTAWRPPSSGSGLPSATAAWSRTPSTTWSPPQTPRRPRSSTPSSTGWSGTACRR